MGVNELALSVGSYELIKAANIKTVSELVQFEAEEILKYRNCDRENLKELSQVLDERDLEFGMDVDDLLEIDDQLGNE
jgi:DNA-directed RNA polymerase subunit alpha